MSHRLKRLPLVESLRFHAVHSRYQLTRAQGYELLARTNLEVVALIPLFAFRELGRVLGEGKLQALFLPRASSRRSDEPPVTRSRSHAQPVPLQTLMLPEQAWIRHPADDSRLDG